MNRRKFIGMVGAAAVTPALASAGAEAPKLFAFLHDGNFCGDSCFYFPSNPVPYRAGMSLTAIKDEHLNVVRDGLKKQNLSDEDIEAELGDAKSILKDAVGAVIVPEVAVKAMSAIWESDPASDSGVYGCNRAAKRVAWELKLLTIGKGMYE